MRCGWVSMFVVSLATAACGGSTSGADDGTEASTDTDTASETEDTAESSDSDTAAETGDTGDTETSGSTGDGDGDGDGDGGPIDCARPLEGYGTTSSFGAGGETCVVTNLDDDGPGSLRDCVSNRDASGDDPTPRVITFEMGGTITLLSDLAIRQPFLTIDGLSAPEPGITLAKTGDGVDGGLVVNTWSGQQTCGHDVLVQGLRLTGVWTEDTEDHSQSAGTLGVDGEDLPGCLHHVVFHRLTVSRAQDGGGDIWGSVTDLTVQYSAFLNSLHPSTYSHAPGGVPGQQRDRISNHHNLYASIHERGPQVRGDIRDSNFEQNVMHDWGAYGFPGGYATRFRCRDGACPVRINVIENHWTSSSGNPTEALVMGEASGPGDDLSIPEQIFTAGNRVPAENVDDGTAPAEWPRDAEAEVTLYADDALVEEVLPCVGAPFRTAEEDATFAEVAAQIEADGP